MVTVKTNNDKKYLGFMKHAKKVTETVHISRTVLKNVSHETDGSLVVTDSHRLYKLDKIHNEKNRKNIDPKTLNTIKNEQNYPETKHLIPKTEKNNPKVIIENNSEIKRMLETFKVFANAEKQLNKENSLNSYNLVIEDEKLYLMNSFHSSYEMDFFPQYKVLLAYVPDETRKIKAQIASNILIDTFEMFVEMSDNLVIEFFVDSLVLKGNDITALLLTLRFL